MSPSGRRPTYNLAVTSTIIQHTSIPPSASDPSAAALTGDPALLRALRDDMSFSPHAVLGGHPAVFSEQSGVVVRSFHPDAIACTLLVGNEARPMLALGGGVFAPLALD